MSKAIIIDDEKKSRLNLEVLLKRHCPIVTVVGMSDNILDGKELIQKQKPDIVFLDVEMPGGDGFKLLEAFSENDFEVIFITAHMDYMLKAIRHSALDYLLKPIDINELKEAVDKAEKKIQKRDGELKESLVTNYNLKNVKSKEILAIPTMEGLQFITVKEIIRCEADVNYTVFYLEKNISFIVPKGLKEYEDLLSDMNFVRVHQSHLVNLVHVKKYVRGEGGYLIMSDESNVEVSRRKKGDFLEKLFS